MATKKKAAKKKRAAITRSKPFVQPEVKQEAAISDATGYGQCAEEDLERRAAYIPAIDPLKEEVVWAHDYSPVPEAFKIPLEEDNEDSGIWGWWLVGIVAIALLAYWVVSS
jgi:hypothetical protein